jgi:hypothetical protein
VLVTGGFELSLFSFLWSNTTLPSEPVLSIDEFIWVPKEQANLVKSAGRAIRFFPLSALIIHP